MTTRNHNVRGLAGVAATEPVLDGTALDTSGETTPPGLPLASGERATSAPTRRSRRRLVLLPVVAIVAAVVAWLVYNAYLDSTHYVSTDNAQVAGQSVPVGSINAGRVVRIQATVGAAVHTGDALAEIALPSQVGVAQNGTPKLDFLGAADARVAVKSPMRGVVVAVPGVVGTTVGPGQPLVTLIDPTQLWVNANVDETNIWRVEVGQAVEVHLDALNATVPGRVEALTPATAASFSLLPQANTSGNFTKVTQVVPVRIAVNLDNRPGLLGGSASVKIRVD